MYNAYDTVAGSGLGLGPLTGFDMEVLYKWAFLLGPSQLAGPKDLIQPT